MKTKRKTKKEIILETANAYTSKTRAMKNGSCAYKSGKNKCAIGRCLLTKSKLFKSYNINLPVSSFYIEPELKPEYRGHSSLFWEDLQYLHDHSSNWDEHGLTAKGKKKVKALLKIWG